MVLLSPTSPLQKPLGDKCQNWNSTLKSLCQIPATFSMLHAVPSVCLHLSRDLVSRLKNQGRLWLEEALDTLWPASPVHVGRWKSTEGNYWVLRPSRFAAELGQSAKAPGLFPALATSLCYLCLHLDYANLESGSLLVTKVFKLSIRELWILHCLASLSSCWDSGSL